MIKYIHGGVIRGSVASSKELVEFKIIAGDAQVDDRFGHSVAISGDGNFAIVGAHREDTGGSDAGAAYIFTRSSSPWVQQQKLMVDDAQASDNFGWSVSISSDGSTAIVGAPYEDTGGSYAGAAYIYTRSGETWTQRQQLIAGDAESSDQFGGSVAISGDGSTVIVGAPTEDTGGSDAGAAYIFTNNGGTWTQQKIQADDVQTSDYFGQSVAISGDGTTAIVGANYEDAGGINAGAAYIFTRSGDDWVEEEKLIAGDAEASDIFGQSVSISGDGRTAIVGAYLEDTGGTDAGAAYIFTRSGETWTQQKIQAGDAQASDNFGWSVAMSDDGQTAIVGACLEDTRRSNAGAAYIFTRSGNTWTQRRKILASDAQASDRFGDAVAISGDGQTAIVGANLEDTGGSNAGAVYIYQA